MWESRRQEGSDLTLTREAYKASIFVGFPQIGRTFPFFRRAKVNAEANFSNSLFNSHPSFGVAKKENLFLYISVQKPSETLAVQALTVLNDSLQPRYNCNTKANLGSQVDINFVLS